MTVHQSVETAPLTVHENVESTVHENVEPLKDSSPEGHHNGGSGAEVADEIVATSRSDFIEPQREQANSGSQTLSMTATSLRNRFPRRMK